MALENPAVQTNNSARSPSECIMIDNRAIRRAQLRQELAALRNAAISELERRGYAVRGKTPAQIREMLKQRPSKKPHISAIDQKKTILNS